MNDQDKDIDRRAERGGEEGKISAQKETRPYSYNYSLGLVRSSTLLPLPLFYSTLSVYLLHLHSSPAELELKKMN